jgi:alkylation response protein AidB-like acyl-CoA dehydrogenase
MDFRLSDEQRAIAELAADIFVKDDQAPSPAWEVLRDAGFLQLLVPEEQGGVGLGQVELGLVLVEQGRGLVTVPLWRHALGALALALSGRPLKADARVALAVNSDVEAKQSDAGWSLHGVVVALPGMAGASKAVIPGRRDGAVRLFEIDLPCSGLSQEDGVLTDGEPASNLTLQGVAAHQLELDGEWLRARVAACVAALSVGVARAALERTAAYVSARQQFGRPIGSFQAVAQRLADAFTDVEVAQTLSIELAWKIDADARLGNSVEVAGYWANQCSHRVAHAAMHLHGGIGADTSYPIHRVLLMSRALELVLGGSRRQIARIGDRLAA